MTRLASRFLTAFITFLAFCVALVGAHWAVSLAANRWAGEAGDGATRFVVDFSLSADGTLALSRAFYSDLKTSDAAIVSRLQLHDPRVSGAGTPLETAPLIPHQSELSPCGRRLAIADRDGGVFVMELPRDSAPGPVVELERFPNDTIAELRWTRDSGSIIAIGYDGLHGWSASTGRLQMSLASRGRPPTAIAMADDPHSFWSAEHHAVVHRRVSDGMEIRTFPIPEGVRVIAVNGDGSRLIALGDVGVVAIDTGDGDRLWGESPASGFCDFVSVSPDGHFVALAPRDMDLDYRRNYQIEVREVETGDLRVRFTPQVGEIAGLLYADHELVYAWGHLGTIRSWDATNGKAIRTHHLSD
jgi:hypothetical protein